MVLWQAYTPKLCSLSVAYTACFRLLYIICFMFMCSCHCGVFLQAFTVLCGSLNLPPDVMIVEYFCDKEKTQLYLHETKELLVSV